MTRSETINWETLERLDPEVYDAIRSEIDREQNSLVMIASENYASPAVMAAQANVMTNKYAEGYPGARYYGGCQFVDQVERLATDRANRLFGSEHANVQPHSGSQANMAVYFSFLDTGDAILGMDLSHGGHLTHGSPVSFSGRMYRAFHYGLDPDTEQINYDRLRDLAKRHQPKLIVAGASAYPRTIDFTKFSEIAHETGAYFMVDMAHIAGLIAVGLHPSPIGKADFVTSTTHKTLRGPRGGLILTSETHGPLLDKGVFPGIQGGPLMHVIAAKAVAFEEALRPEFKDYQQRVVENARILADELMARGIDLVSGGTDNHLLLINLSKRDITGLDAERALGLAGIVANKNSIPSDKRGPKVTSGLRLGTPAITTRGMKGPEIRHIARLIHEVLEAPVSDDVLNSVRGEVSDLCRSFPVYPHLDR